MIHSKLRVAVVMGGYSNESVISLRSGQLILQHLDKEKYEIYPVHILQEGWTVELSNQTFPIDKSDFSFLFENNKIHFDVAVNTIHGTPGEDGHLQAYWELIGLPYTGCGFYQSALTFSKRDTLSVLAKFQIPRAKSIYLSEGDEMDANQITETLGLPLMVKPNQSGSSLGVSKVNDVSELQKALEVAFAEDANVLLEAYLKGREFSVGVMLYHNEIVVLGITEIIPHNEFFDYEAKYLGKSDEVTPAQLPEAWEKAMHETTKKVYHALGMQGFARIDYIVNNEVPHFIEINTNPGLSPQSIFPQQAAHAGYDFKDLFDNEIALALKKQPIWNRLKTN
jgi:D-alanine-D-alanine ligase